MVPNRGQTLSILVVVFVSTCVITVVVGIPVGYVVATETGTVEGIVMDEDWMPIEGATVTIAEYNASTETDENGEFELEIPLVGQAREELEISVLGYENKTTTVRGHSNDTKRFWLEERPGSIEGTITEEDGQPMVGVSVELRDEDDRIVNETTTTVDGTFGFETQEGTYTLLGSLEDHEEASKTTIVTADGSTANLTLSPLPGEVTGTVSGEDDLPIENATVALEDDGANVSTAENGSYALELDGGLNTLIATVDGFENESQTFFIGPNVSRSIDFELVNIESEIDTSSEPDMEPEVKENVSNADETQDDGSGPAVTVEEEFAVPHESPLQTEVVVGAFTAIGIFVGTLLLLAVVAGIRSVTFGSR